ncbi:MAG TPA: aminoacyl-tRNA hydrolase [Bryobacteraceae bacterium]|nr:aminoacyl-tRNA hydrolase [Bryobacteraceae bacterium]
MEEISGRACCIAGLGNPGERYTGTPHNVGFLVVDELAKRHSIAVTRREFSALTGSGRIGSRPVVLAKPQTFMNLSGNAIGPLLAYRNLTNRDLIVVYDELDLPLSAVRIKKNGSAAGHNGVKSIMGALKTDVFTRVRVGIHPNREIDAAEYVLAPWAREWRDEVEELVSYTADAVESILAEGAEKAMAKFNRRARGLQNEDE